MPWPSNNAYQDADDTIGALFGPARRRAPAEHVRESLGAAIAERDHARRCAAAWKALSRSSRREIGYLDRELCDAEARAKDAEHRAGIANRSLAMVAEHIDAAEARIVDLDATVDNLLVERQRMQADLNRLAQDRDGAHEEAASLLARARCAERRCAAQDVELIDRLARITGLGYLVEQARGQTEAERIKASARIRDLEQQRDREWARANNAEAACRDATAALDRAEARIAEMAASVEQARECVRHGISAVSDEDFIVEYARRFHPLRVA